MVKQFFQQVCRHDVRRVLCHLVNKHSFEKLQSRLRPEDAHVDHAVIFLNRDPMAEIEQRTRSFLLDGN